MKVEGEVEVEVVVVVTESMLDCSYYSYNKCCVGPGSTLEAEC